MAHVHVQYKHHVCTCYIAKLWPRPLSSLFYMCDFIYAKLLFRQGKGDGFDHVQTLMTHSVSTVSMYAT